MADKARHLGLVGNYVGINDRFDGPYLDGDLWITHTIPVWYIYLHLP